MSFLRLTDLRSELALRLRQPGLSQAQRDLWLNLAQDDIATYLDPEHLNVPFTFTTVSGTRKYYLDQIDFLKVLSMRDTTNVVSLEEKTMQEIEEYDPDYTDTGTSGFYILQGYEYVRSHLAVAGAVSVVSSSASDITQYVRINGLISGAPDTELIGPLTGTSAVAGSSTWDAGSVNTLTIFSAVKDAVTVGRVSVTSGSDTLAIIPPNLFAEERQPVFLWPEPAAANVMRGHCLRRPRRLVNAEDFPDYPPAYHELVVIGATIKGHLSLFNFKAADEVYQKHFLPFVARLTKNQGQTRGSHSPVIRSSSARLSSPFWNVPTLTGP